LGFVPIPSFPESARPVKVLPRMEEAFTTRTRWGREARGARRGPRSRMSTMVSRGYWKILVRL